MPTQESLLDFLGFINKRLLELQAEKDLLILQFNNKKIGFVYFIKSSDNHCKIGRSKNPDARMRQLQTIPSVRLILIHKVYTDDMVQLEGLVHEVFSLAPNKRIQGEWFEIDENNKQFQTWLMFWDDYEIEMELIENNVKAY
jgi:hypothetical protein